MAVPPDGDEDCAFTESLMCKLLAECEQYTDKEDMDPGFKGKLRIHITEYTTNDDVTVSAWHCSSL